jgi:hypothetical protein
MFMNLEFMVTSHKEKVDIASALEADGKGIVCADSRRVKPGGGVLTTAPQKAKAGGCGPAQKGQVVH